MCARQFVGTGVDVDTKQLRDKVGYCCQARLRRDYYHPNNSELNAPDIVSCGSVQSTGGLRCQELSTGR
jgi:hypothetical protein